MVAGRAALILAAGASIRMGTPKALLPWGTGTLLDYAVAQARDAGAGEIAVVLGPSTRSIPLPGCRVAFNPSPETGRSASICLGAAELPDGLSAILIQSVDQPTPSDVSGTLFAALTPPGLIAIPTFGGRRGHPLCLSGTLRQELTELTEAEQGLRAVVKRHANALVEVPVSAESVVWNLNDPAAYAAAIESLAKSDR
jgi:molybdenum cofactor cytidylyltransferase